MSDIEMNQIDLERAERAYQIIQRAEVAQRDGYFTKDEFKDLKVFIGLTEINDATHS